MYHFAGFGPKKIKGMQLYFFCDCSLPRETELAHIRHRIVETLLETSTVGEFRGEGGRCLHWAGNQVDFLEEATLDE